LPHLSDRLAALKHADEQIDFSVRDRLGAARL
jgi:hypothetical protein